VEAIRELLAAEDDDRRAIERGLHDGVQQQLIAVAVDLQLARQLVTADPAAAASLLDDVRQNVRIALDEVRELAESVHPPLLDSHGLVAAIRMAAATAGVQTQLDAELHVALPRELELTAYRCCVAALSGAASNQSRAAVRLAAHRGRLTFEVALDGSKVNARSLEAVGARIRALGGALDVSPGYVSGWLQLPS